MMRAIKRRVPGVDSMDGAGVRIRRSVGKSQFARIDPFLMLDCFSSDDPDDYIAGFPAHPHRGFETVTYMLDGLMKHRDHMGNEGILRPGSVQWMTAGRGVIHEEMPQQENGLMRGFQLWVNLPASEKMKPAAYQNIEPEEITEISLEQGLIRLVAGSLDIGGLHYEGPVSGISRQPIFMEVRLNSGEAIELPVAKVLSGFVYLFEGTAELGEETLAIHEAAELSEGDRIRVSAGETGARFMLIAGQAINEPIAQYGPFVMNTMDEIEQAISDYRANRLTD
ncbi:pirin family protein [Marinobacterium sp. LSUCC0821]|jgi:redox-sensitive bicupin YhaK (pirin superfamily)|uniref:pirin family protein n=1 Tax=Marinobacterium sp. LSUCC0821 TaxID=2668067 RepID=UPI001451179F|nr:pirin family protein [Marinobacterium sp. LSUCC0821]QJD71322.1 pirin family protein [Marinobacterium sp. LSUCC0821]